MTRRATLTGLIGALVLCLGEGAPRSDSSVPATSRSRGTEERLRYEVGQGLWGHEVLTIDGDGHGRFDFDPVGTSRRPIRAQATLPGGLMQAIDVLCGSAAFCRLRTHRLGVPDEAQPRLQLLGRAPRCDVSLWDGEWRDQPVASRCADAIDALKRSLLSTPLLQWEPDTSSAPREAFAFESDGRVTHRRDGAAVETLTAPVALVRSTLHACIEAHLCDRGEQHGLGLGLGLGTNGERCPGLYVREGDQACGTARWDHMWQQTGGCRQAIDKLLGALKR
jgi:hypothetical protein